jgi:hypothetical protein
MMRGVFKALSTARAAVAVGGAGRNPQLLATALGFCDAQVTSEMGQTQKCQVRGLLGSASSDVAQ